MKKYQRPANQDLTFEYKEFLDYQHFQHMDRVHKIDETLYNCYPDPKTMDLMSKDGKTKAGFQDFLDKTVREFEDLEDLVIELRLNNYALFSSGYKS